MGVALGKREMHTRVSKENLKEGDRFEDAGVDWMIMLRSLFKKLKVRMWTGSVWPRIGTTGSGAHPATYTISTRSFPGVKRPGRGVDNPLPPI